MIALWRRIITAVGRVFRGVAHRWRSSMQARVVSTALAVGVVAVALLGSFLSTSMRDGLFEQRRAQLDVESARSAAIVREAFASTTASSLADVQALMSTQVDTRRNGATSAQGSMLASAGEAPAVPAGVFSSPVLPEVVSDELKAAVLDSEDQMWQPVLIPAAFTASGQDEPGVVFGAVVDVPTAGRYGLYTLYSLQPEQETLWFVQRTLLGGALGILALIGVITWLVTRQAVTPVRRAAATAARLADGHLSERMPGKGYDEMATLARSFNEMAASLQDQIRRMEALSTSQRRFVSDVSHELRTPLTTIRIAGELIHASRDELDPVARRSAEVLQTQLDRFEELLGDLLEISRFDAGAAVLDVEQCDLESIVVGVVDGATPLAERRGVFLSATMPDDPAVADVDRRRVERILRNLVTNAIEHAEGNPVEITVGCDANAVAIVVRDHGIGMTPDEVAHVFDRFWRADPARARTTGGTGLGLAISLEDARLHAGRLEAWGKPGQGASFRLTLPRRAGLSVENPPLPIMPAARALHGLPTGQIPVVLPAEGASPTAIPDLDAVPVDGQPIPTDGPIPTDLPIPTDQEARR
ncbi:histidine kinase [Xylanimonas cellulosilytica DSM 15894]|uniref:Sensor histidine kinase MtrB n=1 Tax=Xylanimonas cellulosilytica (strain DSM 15894 / JCM 12276 / CECT 5975 / KCTC 9989 / LMG 20990 / NBRC 107835 / XIL07) TaxID=446471 RepID=D1BWI3_XYLCX|nr:MtrAB system histidine kinase MtrB [Xylanimonas cellulosilytica]ACZ31528.1 histidine kinase [Xylanimonas cellulosilytica DSM 15894]